MITLTMEKILIVTDMINGFINEGAIADKAIGKITPEIVKHVEEHIKGGHKIIAFMDCHNKDSVEFKAFPPHCIKGTSEADLIPELKPFADKMTLLEKNSTSGFMVKGFADLVGNAKEITITGCCTDICILNLAIPLKNYFNEQNKDVRVIVPKNSVATYHIDNVHDAEEFSEMAFKLMKQAGVEVV